jgi:hypothetical protein
MAGVPFDVLERLRTPETAVAARRLNARQAELADTRSAAERLLVAPESAIDGDTAKALRRVLRANPLPAASR